jgi:hypothetical protein
MEDLEDYKHICKSIGWSHLAYRITKPRGKKKGKSVPEYVNTFFEGSMNKPNAIQGDIMEE